MTSETEYLSTLDFLYTRLQSFHNQGAVAYKPGLDRTLRLAESFGSPQNRLKVVHIGGTNGKGSTAHSVASVLQSAGLNVGLYTSPHLVDFRERIRVNGVMIPKQDVVDFVKSYRESEVSKLEPSFFELTTVMALDYFNRKNADVAVIEVGLGGRLDSTNIVHPIVTAVTNIAFDHTALLGNTLEKIATEKAGIFKKGIKAIVGRSNPETDSVFRHIAKQNSCDITIAEKNPLFTTFDRSDECITYRNTPWGCISSELTGECQPENMAVILNILKELERQGFVNLDSEVITAGLMSIKSATGLRGRWMTVSEKPKIIVDTAHNPDGWRLLSQQLAAHLPHPLGMVIGFVNDNDIPGVIDLLPRQAKYYIVSPSVERAADTAQVQHIALERGLDARIYNSVNDGVEAAVRELGDESDSLIFIGGSTFVVADYLSERQ